MKLLAFSVYDKKSQSYSRPFFSLTKGEATRAFSDMVNDKTHPIGKHPEDYSVYQFATFDDQNAQTKPLDPTEIGTGLDFIDVEYQNYLELKADMNGK